MGLTRSTRGSHNFSFAVKAAESITTGFGGREIHQPARPKINVRTNNGSHQKALWTFLAFNTNCDSGKAGEEELTDPLSVGEGARLPEGMGTGAGTTVGEGLITEDGAGVGKVLS